jgi:hypothetical protein
MCYWHSLAPHCWALLFHITMFYCCSLLLNITPFLCCAILLLLLITMCFCCFPHCHALLLLLIIMCCYCSPCQCVLLLLFLVIMHYCSFCRCVLLLMFLVIMCYYCSMGPCWCALLPLPKYLFDLLLLLSSLLLCATTIPLRCSKLFQFGTTPTFAYVQMKEKKQETSNSIFFNVSFLFPCLFFILLRMYNGIYFVNMYVFGFFLLYMFCMLRSLGVLFVCRVYYSYFIMLVAYITCMFFYMKRGEENEIFCLYKCL